MEKSQSKIDNNPSEMRNSTNRILFYRDKRFHDPTDGGAHAARVDGPQLHTPESNIE